MSENRKLERKILRLQQAVTTKQIRQMLALHKMSNKELRKLLDEQDPAQQMKFYIRFKMINDAAGLPTQSFEDIIGSGAEG
ncbi:MAG: hypothetical protein HY849_00140 [Nitrosomonadales bacterium]|nr:hypothetical protein [Nitrosomonadales bacterium]